MSGARAVRSDAAPPDERRTRGSYRGHCGHVVSGAPYACTLLKAEERDRDRTRAPRMRVAPARSL